MKYVECVLCCFISGVFINDDCVFWLFFFFQAEDGIRDWSVTGVQTCALPIWLGGAHRKRAPTGAISTRPFRIFDPARAGCARAAGSLWPGKNAGDDELR